MTATVIVAAYFLGAVPFAVVIARVFGVPDPRHYGSGNPGATNVARSGNKAATVLTLLADFGKGAVLVVLADSSIMAALAGGMAVVGHVFSIFLRFKGGKGVATALGVFCAWYWLAGIVSLVAWALVFVLCRTSALASIAAMLTGVVMLIMWTPLIIAWAGCGVAALVIVRHWRNIADLLRGRERSFSR